MWLPVDGFIIVVARLLLFCMKMLRWESQQEDVMYIWSTRMVFRPNVHLTVSSSTSYLNLVYGGIEFVFLQFSTQFIPLFSSCHPTCSIYYFKLQLFYNSHFYLYGPVIFYLSIQPIYNLIHRILQGILHMHMTQRIIYHICLSYTMCLTTLLSRY